MNDIEEKQKENQKLEEAVYAVLKNFNNSIYLKFRSGIKWDYFIRLHTGEVQVTKLPKDLASKLTPVTQQIASPKHCAEVFLGSTLPKTERASKILTAIFDGKRLPEFWGLESCPVGDLEIKILSRKDQQQIIGDATAAFVKRKKDEEGDDDEAEGATDGETDRSTLKTTLGAKKAKTSKKDPKGGGQISSKKAKIGSTEGAKDPNVITLGEICKKAKIDSADARQLMRKAKWMKPTSGRWEWPKKEAETIQADLEKLIKADKT